MRRFVHVLWMLAMLLPVVQAGQAEAQEPLITLNALHCTPVPNSAAASALLARGYYAHAYNETGTRQLLCPLTSLPTNADTFELVYLDSDGSYNGAYVHAALYEVLDTATSATMIASLNSNSSPVTGYNTLQAGISHTFDLANASYYVLVSLYRNTTSREGRLRAIRLYDSAP